jgi:hypothetical protein
MTLYSSNNNIIKYDNAIDILLEFYRYRLEMYDKRKEYILK